MPVAATYANVQGQDPELWVLKGICYLKGLNSKLHQTNVSPTFHLAQSNDSKKLKIL